MRITGVHTAVVEANYDWTYVRVDAEGEGLSGLGECFCAPGLTAIIRDLAPLLIGEDARDVDRLWAKLRWGCSGAGSAAGIVYNAISGIEAALWDLVGQHYGVPIYRLLGGGKFRDSVRMYADCHAGEALHSMNALMIERPARWGQEGPDATAVGAIRNPEHGRAYAKAAPDEVFTPELYAARAKQVVADLGFSALKFDLDVPTPYMQDTASGTLSRAEIKYMVELAAAVIDAVGDEVDVAFDCHWRYQVADAQRLAHELEPLGLMWLEDPVPPENVPALARVTKSTTTTIATGENGYMRHGFREAFESGAIDVAAPDPQKTGGLLETRRIADYADTHYISMAPHCIASPIGTIANVHVCAAIPNFLALEWHGMSVPFWNDLAAGWEGGSVIERGRIKVPEAPGPGRDAEPGPRARVRAARRALLRRMIAARYSRDRRLRRAGGRRGRDAAAGAGRGARAARGGGREPDRLEGPRRRHGVAELRLPGARAGRRGRDRGRRRGRREGLEGRAGVGVPRRLAEPVGHRGRVHGRAGGEGGAARRRVVRARGVPRRARAHGLPLPVLRRPDRGPARARRGRRRAPWATARSSWPSGAARRSSPPCRAPRRPSSRAPRT